MGCKTNPKSTDMKKDNTDEQIVTMEIQHSSDVTMVTDEQATTIETSQVDRTQFSTPPAHINRRLQPERPRSAHIHRVCGQLLRMIGDDYLCSSCGRALQTIGDQLSTEYAIRKALSCNDLEKLNAKR